MLTLDAIDPFGKIPTFKLCAVNVEKAPDLAPRLVRGYGRPAAARQMIAGTAR